MVKSRKPINMLANIFMGITFLGSMGLGAMFALSEIAYANINSFFLCPIWYQILTWAFLIVSIGGVVGSAFYKNKKN